MSKQAYKINATDTKTNPKNMGANWCGCIMNWHFICLYLVSLKIIDTVLHHTIWCKKFTFGISSIDLNLNVFCRNNISREIIMLHYHYYDQSCSLPSSISNPRFLDDSFLPSKKEKQVITLWYTSDQVLKVRRLQVLKTKKLQGLPKLHSWEHMCHPGAKFNGNSISKDLRDLKLIQNLIRIETSSGNNQKPNSMYMEPET